MPGTKGNRNALRAGTRSYLATGRLPSGCAYIRRLGLALRKQVEAEVVAQRGELSLYDSALSQSVVRHEIVGLLCLRWLRVAEEKGQVLSPADRLAYLKAAANATDARDAAMRRLGLDCRADVDPWSVLHEVRRGDAVDAEPDIDADVDAAAEPAATPPGLNPGGEAESASTPSPSATNFPT